MCDVTHSHVASAMLAMLSVAPACGDFSDDSDSLPPPSAVPPLPSAIKLGPSVDDFVCPSPPSTPLPPPLLRPLPPPLVPSFPVATATAVIA